MENKNQVALILGRIMSNELCVITFDDKTIRGRDVEDKYNEPVFFSKGKQGLKNGWKKLGEKFDGETTMYQAMRILEEAHVKTHSYCAVD